MIYCLFFLVICLIFLLYLRMTFPVYSIEFLTTFDHLSVSSQGISKYLITDFTINLVQILFNIRKLFNT